MGICGYIHRVPVNRNKHSINDKAVYEDNAILAETAVNLAINGESG